MSTFKPRSHHSLSGTLKISQKKKYRREEDEHQIKFVEWARANGINLQHQNNGASTKLRRIYQHRMGCTAGAADIIIFDRIPNLSGARGLALEFKTKNGKQSKAQVEWQEMVERRGWVYEVVRSFEQAKMICEALGLVDDDE